MDDWLREARDELGRLAGVPPAELELDDEDEEAILELARIAAHASGERTNAPLICFLAGRAAERAGVDPERLLDIARRDV